MTKTSRSEKQEVSQGMLRQDAESSRGRSELKTEVISEPSAKKAGGPEDKILREDER